MSTQTIGGDGSFTNLEITEPDLVVEDGEGQDVIDKGFRLASLWGHAENLWSGFTPRTKTAIKEKRTCVNNSFVSFPHSVSSKALSKLKTPLLPFKQLPVILSSSMV